MPVDLEIYRLLGGCWKTHLRAYTQLLLNITVVY